MSFPTARIHIESRLGNVVLVGGRCCTSVLSQISYNYLHSFAGLVAHILLSLVKNTEECSFQQCTHHRVIKTEGSTQKRAKRPFLAVLRHNIKQYFAEVTLELHKTPIYHLSSHESSHIVKSIIDSPYSLVFPSEPHNDH